jgi:hypothetical protein
MPAKGDLVRASLASAHSPTVARTDFDVFGAKSALSPALSLSSHTLNRPHPLCTVPSPDSLPQIACSVPPRGLRPPLPFHALPPAASLSPSISQSCRTQASQEVPTQFFLRGRCVEMDGNIQQYLRRLASARSTSTTSSPPLQLTTNTTNGGKRLRESI